MSCHPGLFKQALTATMASTEVFDQSGYPLTFHLTPVSPCIDDLVWPWAKAKADPSGKCQSTPAAGASPVTNRRNRNRPSPGLTGHVFFTPRTQKCVPTIALRWHIGTQRLDCSHRPFARPSPRQVFINPASARPDERTPPASQTAMIHPNDQRNDQRNDQHKDHRNVFRPHFH